MNFEPLINGRLYGWSDITCNVSGTIVSGILAINYKDKQKIEGVYAGGSDYNGLGVGNKERTGNISLLKEEVDALVNAIPSGRIQDYPPFPIIVSYMPEGATTFSTNKLLMCKFTENSVDVKQGDTSIGVQIELFIGDIKWK